MSDTKDESNSTTSDLKEEESSPKTEEAKSVDESSKDSEKDSIKDESVKEESGKEGSEKDGSSDKESSDDEEGDSYILKMRNKALFDRPVEQVGCRARKQVERLEISFNTPKEKHEIKAGKGQKLGECPRIEHQIQKTSIEDLKPVHKILFGRVGSANQIKKSIRKFSGFPFGKSSSEFKRKRAFAEKLTANVLKRICEVLDLERSGSKEEIITRILGFLLEPKDSGKKVKSKNKGSTKDKGKNSEKKPKSIKKPKAKKASSDEETSINDSASEKGSEKEDEEEEQVDEDDDSDYDAKKKAKKNPKAKKTPSKIVAKQSDKKGKAKKEEKKSTGKGTKRKREDDDDSASDTETDSSDEEPIAKKRKMPSDEEIKKLVKKILDAADLQQITMKKVIKQIADAYPDCDLSHKKAFIKSTVKSVIS